MFEWYQRYNHLAEDIKSLITKESEILIVGCGSSRMGEELYDEGYQLCTNLDSCSVIIRHLQEKYKDKNPTFRFQEGDVRAMEFPSDHFDLVIDKALFDSLQCGESAPKNTHKALSEISRVTKPGGVYFMVSFLPGPALATQLDKPEYHWTVSHSKIAKPYLANKLTLNPEDKNTPKEHTVVVAKKKETVMEEGEENK